MVGVLLVMVAPRSLASPGELDGSFGTGGVLTTNFGGTYDWAYAAVQSGEGILAAGVSNAHGSHDFALARYAGGRALDATFGEGGTVTTGFGEGSYDWAYAMALQPDGRIVVAGVSDVSGSKDLALARYLPNGALDGDFGAGGLMAEGRRPLTTDIVRSVAIQPDGKIVVTGVTFEDKASVDPNGDFIVARYQPDGSADPTFGVGGIVTTDFGDHSYDDAYALVIQPDRRILLGGYSATGGGPGVLFGADNLALARYTPEGLPDMSFGRQGQVVLDAGSLDEEIRALALTPRGWIVAAGFVNGERGGDMLLARFNPQGVPDTEFGTDGRTVSDLSTYAEGLSDVAIQPDGRIVAAGDVAGQKLADFAVLRYDPAGRLEGSFGTGGLATADVEGRQDKAAALVVQPDGKLVAVGCSEHNFAVARFNGS